MCDIFTFSMFSTPFYVPECRSTMELADRLLESRELGFGGVVVTDHQTQGQGTHGRNWEDTPGASLLVTLILDPAWTDGVLPLRIGLAVIDMLAAQGLDGLELKWPNDCLCREQKIAGVLCRSSPRRTLAGIGVNVRAHPDGGDSTSLLRSLRGAASPGTASPGTASPGAASPGTARCPAPSELLSPLLEACSERLRATDIREACEKRLRGLGREVTVDLPDGRTVRGRLSGLSADGGLLLEGHPPVYAGRLRR